MDYLAVVRHGLVNGMTGKLSHVGEMQIDRLGKSIERYVTDSGVVAKPKSLIITSQAPRAAHASKILARYLQPEDIIGDSFLWTGPDAPQDYNSNLLFPFTNYLLKNDDELDFITLVTHLEFCRDFPSYFTDKKFRKNLPFSELQKGEAYILDLKERKWLEMPEGNVVYFNL